MDTKPSIMYRISILKPLDFIYNYTLEATCSILQVVHTGILAQLVFPSKAERNVDCIHSSVHFNLSFKHILTLSQTQLRN